MLTDAARRTALQWRFEPLPAGQDSATFRLTMRFRLIDVRDLSRTPGWFYLPPDTLEIWASDGGMHRYDANDVFPDASFDNLDRMRESLQGIRELRIYQGLPSVIRGDWPACSPDSIVLIRGFQFHAGPAVLIGKRATEVVAILGDTSTFVRKGTGISRCGGFHPDFAVEWTVDKQRHRALLCFGCFDMKYAGPEATVLCEISSEPGERLRALLEPFAPHAPCRRVF